ncbi:MAG: hypothetical protein MUO31_08795 [Thermodesulfovibrionales bacterium]|nr:hypothetical protein [Thermodesulfovibrionales bacterium]
MSFYNERGDVTDDTSVECARVIRVLVLSRTKVNVPRCMRPPTNVDKATFDCTTIVLAYPVYAKKRTTHYMKVDFQLFSVDRLMHIRDRFRKQKMCDMDAILDNLLYGNENTLKFEDMESILGLMSPPSTFADYKKCVNQIKTEQISRYTEKLANCILHLMFY